MKAKIITIGDEILIGQITDTNSAWMAEEITSMGFQVAEMVTVSDEAAHITQAVHEALTTCDLVLITGGLGPTKDDLTKDVLASYFNSEMVFNQEVFEDIERLFRSKGRTLSDLNRSQAEVPAACEAVRNSRGTAPGMWFDRNGKVLVSMPGVPYEMKGMMEDVVMPKLRNRFQLPHIYHRTILTQGIPESLLAHKLTEWEDALPESIKLAYLPSAGLVRLRLSATGSNLSELEKRIDDRVQTLRVILGDAIFGEDKTTLEETVGELLKQRGETVFTAESCTGGNIAQLFTSHAGSSAFFIGGIVAYSNAQKELFLKVDPQIIQLHGAVSIPTVEAMALGAKQQSGSHWAIATSGIAGPDGGTPDKPVGTVCIAIAGPDGITSEQFLFGALRSYNIRISSLTALQMLRKRILNI
jgi:nicotinamide-nucleotide amidase